MLKLVSLELPCIGKDTNMGFCARILVVLKETYTGKSLFLKYSKSAKDIRDEISVPIMSGN